MPEATAALVEHAVEGCPEAILIERMQHFQPARGRTFQGAAFEAEQRFGLGTGEDLVGGDVPVPDQIAGAGERQRAAFHIRDDALG